MNSKTNRWTYGPLGRPSYRDARMHLKTKRNLALKESSKIPIKALLNLCYLHIKNMNT